MEEKAIQVFSHPQFGNIRCIKDEKGDPWFVGKDVAEKLGYTNPRKALLDHVDLYDKTDGVTIRDSMGRNQNPVIINESGLYSLILSSKLPQAREFKHWVTSKVLPSIRKHGAYMTQKTLTDLLLKPEGVITLLTQLQAEQTKRIEAEQVVEEQRPKVEFADAVTSSKGCIYIGQLANLLYQNGCEVGQNRLFKKLRELGYLFKAGRDNRPKQEYIERGYFEIKVNIYTDDFGDEHESLTTMVTPKGQEYFINLFCKKQQDLPPYPSFFGNNITIISNQ